MVAARNPMSLFDLGGFRYEDIIESIDWNRVLIEANGLHLRRGLDNPTHSTHSNSTTCGICLRDVLLRTNPAASHPSPSTEDREET